MTDDAPNWYSMGLLLLVLLLVIIALILAFVLAIRSERHEHRSDKRLTGAENKLNNLKQELERSRQAIAGVTDENRRLQSEVASWKEQHDRLYGGFERLYKAGLLERWFTFVQNASFRNRSELGAFLLYPMLWFLEYPERAFSLEHPVTMMGATSGPPAYVSCVVYDITGGANVPLFLLETIPPDQNFTTAVVDEIVLKAYSAQVVKFAMTNGDQFILYNLLNRSTAGGRVRQFSLHNLRENWQFIQSELHPGAFPQ